jgi:hypothetical protein
VAAALADAYLTCGQWRRATLLDAGHAVLGARPRWLGPVVTAVLRAYRRPPTDRPRELAGFIAALRQPLTPAQRRRFVPWRLPVPPTRVRAAVIRQRLVGPTRTVRMRWNTPRIDHVAALAEFFDVGGDELDWFADRREINRYARDPRLRHYHYTWLPHRLIEAPKPRLRALQRRVLDEILARLPVHHSVHGFVPGRDVHTFARPHAGQRTVVRMDLRTFFSSVTAPRVYGVLRTAGYPEPVAHSLAALATTRTPADVLTAAPAWWWAALLRQPHLPQGAPTSPALANLCAFRLDRRLSGLADRYRMAYTRYADDLAFSGAIADQEARRLTAQVSMIAAAEGFRTRAEKTRVRGQADRQQLAGLVVNSQPAVPREQYDRLRAILHDAAARGLDAANRDGHPDFAAHLTGRVAWVSYGHPTRAAKLRALLAVALAPRSTPASP